MKAKLGELEVNYELEGPAGAPVLVFVHGVVASLEVWRGQAARLRDCFRVLRYDLRSHGSTSILRTPCTRADLAGDLVALLDFLGIEQAGVVGHSAGGVIAMQTALDFTGRVKALGLVGTSSECNDKTAEWWTKCIALGAEKGGEAVMRQMGVKPGSGPVPDGTGLGSVIAAMRSLNEDPLTERLRGLDIPCLIIVGDKDFLGAGGSVILSRAIADSELDIVEGRGHGIYVEDPDWFASRLEGFFARHLQG